MMEDIATISMVSQRLLVEEPESVCVTSIWQFFFFKKNEVCTLQLQ